MYTFHKDKDRYFRMQYETSRDYIIPFLSDHLDLSKSLDVLELGCAEAGVLKPFAEQKHNCTGIELSDGRLKLAAHYLQDEIAAGNVRFSNSNIYDLRPGEDGHLYDLIILKDVIEHIPDQEKFIPYLATFLKPNGYIFFGFPPWWMPFGGHQQLCRNKYLQKMAWMHLLPRPIYKSLLNSGESNPAVVKELMEIHDTGITIERFNGICRKSSLDLVKQNFWLFNPIYKWKFGLSPKSVISPFKAIPYLRNFYTTAYYALLQNRK